MASKEALDKLFMACDNDLLYEQSGIMFATELTNIIEKDLDILEKLKEENDKLKKVIEILKDILEIKVGVRVDERKILMVSIVEVGEWFALDITEEQYDLLKEVLENE